MSEGSGIEPWSIAVGAGVAGAVGLIFAAVKGLFSRGVGAVDRVQDEMRADVKNILLELRSMHDEQTRQRSDILSLTEKYASLKDALKACHERIDALISTPPPGKRTGR